MMSHDLFWIYALNLIINGFLSFLTIACLIQLFIFVLKVHSPRFNAILLCIPFLKLILDPFLYDFKNWALQHQINPIEAKIGSRELIVQFCLPVIDEGILFFSSNIRLLVGNGRTFTPADIAALSMTPPVVKGMTMITGLVSLTLLIAFLFRLLRSMRALSLIEKNARPCKRTLKNQKLIQKLKQINCRLIVSPDVGIPCAFGVIRKQICFPKALVDRFTQAEFEAVIAHELAHLIRYDSVVRVLCRCIRTFFWWVPTDRWLKQIEFNQEIACDDKIRSFDMNRSDLASAIIKTAKAVKNNPDSIFLTCFVKDGLISKRIRLLLDKSNNKNTKFELIRMGLASIIAASILSGRFWIF